ncbi:hypothetical protein [Erwinia phyllosphaerae]|uniref:hypothetical protein n=1 Tax=Erwinia phyllosphaerae TaxID=2853256 RepID=UPI001FED5541|nr:hypothetical protein [Erwinia phyllosphaerae]MBV4368862.1 hypothetical protein [Erwinia phyllosphaerae]
MTIQPDSPLTFKNALKISGSVLLTSGAMMWAAYTQVQDQFTQVQDQFSRVQDQFAQAQNQFTRVRDEISSLRSTSRDDFNRIAAKLDSISITLTAVQLEQAVQKAINDSKQSQ